MLFPDAGFIKVKYENSCGKNRIQKTEVRQNFGRDMEHASDLPLLFSRYDLDIREEKGKWRLKANIRGEELNQEKHQLVADVKAVSLHNFKVRKTAEGWRAEVILDV